MKIKMLVKYILSTSGTYNNINVAFSVNKVPPP